MSGQNWATDENWKNRGPVDQQPLSEQLPPSPPAPLPKGGRGETDGLGKTAMLLTNTSTIHKGHKVHEDWKSAESLTNTETIPPGVRT